MKKLIIRYCRWRDRDGQHPAHRSTAAYFSGASQGWWMTDQKTGKRIFHCSQQVRILRYFATRRAYRIGEK